MSDVETLRVSSERPRRSGRDAARVEMRNAVQWLARITQSFSPAPEGRLRLSFDADARQLQTPDLGRDVRLGLSLPGLVLQFFEQGAPTPHEFDLDDRSSTEVEAWLLIELLHRGFDRNAFCKALPYDWADQMSGDEVKYSPHRLSDALERLTQDLVAAAACLDDTVSPGDVFYLPSRDALGAALACGTGAVYVVYDTSGEKPHYRVSQQATGTASGEDIVVAIDDERCPAEQIRAAIARFQNA